MKTLRDILDKKKIISLVGNAKNAGKTTVLNYLINEYKTIPIAITSIGLDGERLDQITILPKPRIFAFAGVIVVTATKCLTEFEASYDILESTNIMSSLGIIKIVKITKPGNVLVAGPVSILQIKNLLNILSKYNLNKVLIDGAFSKLAFASISDAILYSIGASYSNNFEKVIRDSILTLKILGLPKIEIDLNLEETNNIVLIDNNNNLITLSDNSTISSGKRIIEKITKDIKYIYIPGAVGTSFIEAFIENKREINCDIILNNPTSLILNEKLLNNLFLLDQKVYVLNPLNVVAVTYNPYSPTGHNFDSNKFRERLENEIKLPIFNVLEKGR